MLPGGGELLIVILVIFLLFGGRELPKIARTMGKYTAIMRRSLNDIRREFNRIGIEEELREAKESMDKVRRDPLGLSTPKAKEDPEAGKPNAERKVPLTADDLDAEPDSAAEPPPKPVVKPAQERIAQGGDATSMSAPEDAADPENAGDKKSE